ncbi:nucleoside-diphosphate-sugar epimerase [Litorivivens lipolytica]|uniref:Nucleoside-diphosphate-sugar epimerase n=1 Tax=Litorivivens lipolytica TaxID=1524264 RepID=A0A7W4W6V5_9GAMM|nr:NAD-dependent epimerase/dehydratase family protein [Litorivivens lipolytica]MBB3048505.1 nucleoside-diphosphate-sugar epimerase [Litorivivens lipolytica]
MKKIILAGGAGLVGQNLVARLVERDDLELVVLDKHKANLSILRDMQPGVVAEYADLAKAGDWQGHFDNASAVVMLQAQIGGIYYEEFERNNLAATDHVLDAMKRYNVPNLVHISSSVVNSQADDFYTRSKTLQEQRVLESGVNCVVLRPTLMFGWFDRKHLGWLSRFMQKVPVFPVPGLGRYPRQPLYAGDFCNIILRCLEKPEIAGVYDISGLEHIDYIDLIKTIKSITKAKSLILPIPYSVFFSLLWVWALFDKNPPFTVHQLRALVIDESFEIIDWPGIFNVKATSFEDAVRETFTHPVYSDVVLEF